MDIPGPILVAIACPLCLLIGVFTGAWIMHRAHNHLSPVPDVAKGISGLISIFKTKPTHNSAPRVRMPSMRA